MMHFNPGVIQCAAKFEPSARSTGNEKMVGCQDCKDVILLWNKHFPKAHHDKMEGGRR
jgi:hypothetical protein